MTYLWLNGLPIRVSTDSDGKPLSLIWNSKRHEIRHILNRWIFHDLWWSKDEEIWRDYYYLTTDSGLMAVIFKDNVSGIWYIYRLYD